MGKHSFEHFQDWLEEHGLSKKVAGDYVSRCRRVEKVLELSLLNSVKSEDRFVALLLQLNQFALVNTTSKSGFYTLKKTLKKSVSMYAEFVVGTKAKCYPRLYGSRVVKASMHIDDV